MIEGIQHFQIIQNKAEFGLTLVDLDSKDNRDIQMADYIANLVWKKYNCPKEDLSRRVSQYYRTYISKFPLKLFGINPTLKELEEANSENEKKSKELVANL